MNANKIFSCHKPGIKKAELRSYFLTAAYYLFITKKH